MICLRRPDGERILPDPKPLRSRAPSPAPAPLDGAALLGLARSDPASASRALAALPPRKVADVLLGLAPRERESLLLLVERPGDVVPLLPEAELATTLRATGLADAGWLLAHATPEQRVAGVDLDVWRDERLSHERLGEWIDALIEAGEETLCAALEELDVELWIVALKEMADFRVIGGAGRPPDGWQSEDGVVWYDARSAADGERVRAILDAGRSTGTARAWELAWGAACDEGDESESWALRWKDARLNDLGFPDHEEAMRVYRPLRVEEVPVVDTPPGASPAPGRVVETRARRGSHVQQALAGLPPGRATDVLGSILAVGNAIAVADELPLSEPESLQRALAKAMLGVDLGLARLAGAHGLALDRALDQTRPLDLFRIGATLEPRLGRGKTLEDLESADDDWGVELFRFDPDDPRS